MAELPPPPGRPRQVVQIGAAGLVAFAELFGLAGTLRWGQAWAFLAVYMVTVVALSGLVFARSPDLVAERARAGQLAPAWDRVLVMLMTLSLPVMLGLAALDHRFGWTPALDGSWGLAALVAIAAGNALTLVAMRANRFFSSHVRLQGDRGHVVVSQGPYAWVRHPGYVGALLFNLGVPVLLGSWAAGGVGVLFLFVCVGRTALEDAMLQRELEGYRAYCEQVRYRLVPFAW